MKRALGLISANLLLGCTEPNPNLMETGEGTSSGGSTATTTTGDPTSATTSPTSTSASSSTTEDPDTTMGTTIEPTESSTTLTTSDETSTGAPICASTCVALPPGDWQGPAAVLHDAPDDPAPDCAGDFTEPSAAVFANLDAPAAMCTCECDAPTGLGCSSVTVSQFTDAACTAQAAMPATTNWVVTTSCNGLANLQAANGNRYQASSVIDAGSCDPNPTSVVPDAVFGDRYTACGLGRLDVIGCDAGNACVSPPTAPYDGRICIWHDGNQQCPTDIGYDVRSIYYGDVADDRACDTCTCGDPEGDCDGGVQIFGTDTCNEAPTGNLNISGACAVMGNITAARVAAGDPDPDPAAECAPSDVQATGQAEGIDPVTFCCDS
ncbi:MAG TPA: hypothetical protein VG755_39250 [Nannocystaceae bacterium]|nr:hypothetical protein [Nannocystaceae bacterium]